MRALGIKHGYYTPDDADLAYQIDSIIEWSLEIQRTMFRFMEFVQVEEPDDSVVKKYLAVWDLHNEGINSRLRRTKSSFIAGTEDITVADFVCGAMYF